MRNSYTFKNIYRWDIDKTYLSTELESVRDYIRTAFEKAEKKENVPGTVTLIKELYRGPGEEEQKNPIIFLSASPEQMRRTLLKKIELDGIVCEGVILKNQLTHIRKMKFGMLKRHIGFKVASLLRSRASLPISVPEVAFGDDSESDAIIYSLYSDITARRIVGRELRTLLESLDVVESEIAEIFRLVANLPIHDPIESIYINVVLRGDISYFEKFGERLVPTSNSFQAAVHLLQEGKISQSGLLRVAREVMDIYGFSKEKLGEALIDLYNRGFLLNEFARIALEFLKGESIIPQEIAFAQTKFSLAQKVKNWWRETFPIRPHLAKEEPSAEAKYMEELSKR